MSKEETVKFPIPAEDYEEYAKWAKKLGFENVDAFFEEATRKYLEHLKRKVEEEKVMSDTMVEVHVRLYQPFYKFIKEYMAFFGSKHSIEDFCRQAICEAVNSIYLELDEFASNKQSLIDRQEWFEKWPHISITAYPCPDEEEQEKEQDC